MVRIRPRASGSEGDDASASIPPPPPAPPPLPPVRPKPSNVFELTDDIWTREAGTAASVPEPEPPPSSRVTRLAPLTPASGRDVSLSAAGLIMAVVIFVAAVLAAATGLAKDDDGDRDLATAESTTTSVAQSTTTGPSLTVPAGATSTTLAGAVPTVPSNTTVPQGGNDPSPTIPSSHGGGGGGGGSGGGNPTPTTQPPATTGTTAPAPTTTTATTAPPSNQPMTITMETSPPNPVAGNVVTVTVTFRDEDAVPTSNCMDIAGDDGIVLTSEECDAPDCPTNPGIPAQGGTRTIAFDHTFDQAGRYEIKVTGHSGSPECGNPWASRKTQTFTVDVAAAE